jgi:hypothetical protein
MVALAENPFISVALAQAKATNNVADAQKIAQALRNVQDNSPGAQAATNVLPQATLNQLTSNFDVTRIPLSRLRQMMRDPMIAFAFFFIRAQILRARWAIQCSDAQVAAFIDQALREIYPSLVSQYLMKLNFGYQALVKRFETRPGLDWTYIDPADALSPEKPVWDQTAIDPLGWKKFAALPPESVEPLWTPAGDFNGINYKPIATSGSATKESNFDVLHSLWVTNESESVFDSLWGYPRIGYAYRFWWSFWFNWGLADRHFEKDADPPAIVYYPSNKPDLIGPDGNAISRRQVALNIGDRARSNSTIALPSDLQLADDGTTKNIREWEIDFAKGGGNFDAFQQRFDQLQVLILRACMVPEQAFLEGKGGTSSRNVAGELQDAFAASQIVLMQELDYDINRYVIPQLVAANFPEKVAQGIKAKKVTKGFDTEDLALAKIIIQGVANKDASQLELDLPAMIDAVGLPRLTPADIAKKNAELQAQAQQTTPDPQQAAPGQAGVTPTGLYYSPREVITLSTVDEDASAAFMAELTAVGALRDPVILSDAQRLRNTWQASLSLDFSVARNLVQDYGTELTLDEDFLQRFFRRIKGRAHDTAAQTRRALGGIMRRASTTEFEKVGLADFSWDPFYSEKASAYLSERTKVMTEKISATPRDQVKTDLAELVKKGTPPSEMPGLLQAHFKMFSGWRADQVVRTEVAMAYNMATLLAAEEAGIKQVQALDAQLGPERSDPYCIARNGKVFTLAEAFEEAKKEHPNGTLQFRILRKPVTVKRLPIPANAPAGVLASYEEQDNEIVVTFSEALNERQENNYLINVFNRIEEGLTASQLAA